MKTQDVTAKPLSPATRKRLGSLVALAALALVALMATIPLTAGHEHEHEGAQATEQAQAQQHEGQQAGGQQAGDAQEHGASGADAEPEAGEEDTVAGIAETVGKMLGLAAATLVLLQFGLSSRLKALDRVFGLPRIFIIHRWLAVTAVSLATLHPFLLFYGESHEVGAFSLAQWPLFVGAALLISLWTASLTGLYRRFAGIEFQFWYVMHRSAMFAAAGLVALHVLNVTETFQSGWPRWTLFILFGLYLALFVWAKAIRPFRNGRNAMRVAAVENVGRDVHAVTLEPQGERVFPYLPGQFSFVRFTSESVPNEEHHFTLSSAPARGESLIYTIRCSGDFTSGIGRLRPGDMAVLDGPYGLFSHLAQEEYPGQELVMVAGGIGITPMLSMLRQMADAGDTRRVTLVWANRAEEDIVCREEFERFPQQLPNLTVHHVMSRQKDFAGRTGHVDTSLLGDVLDGVSPKALCFVCGPPAMMDAAVKGLKSLGFKGARILTERFAL